MYKIDDTRPTEEGTVFETTINNTKMKALFDTGATKSVMLGKMYRNLKLGPLDDSNLPSVVGANGSSLGVMGRIRCTIAFEKDEDKFDQTFLVCENLQRGVILGKDFARQNCAGMYWTPHNTRVLHTNLKTIAETKELIPSGTAAIHVKQTTKLPPRSLAVVDVNINTTSQDKIRMILDSLCQSRHPNMYMMVGGSFAVVRSYALGCEPLVTGNLTMGLTIRSSRKQELSSVYQFIDVLYSLCIYEALRH